MDRRVRNGTLTLVVGGEAAGPFEERFLDVQPGVVARAATGDGRHEVMGADPDAVGVVVVAAVGEELVAE